MNKAADVVLVHGGWHSSTCWERVVDRLTTFGLAAHAVDLPLEGFASDVDAVRSAMRLAGPSPVVVAHSYGGAVVSEAVVGMDGTSMPLIYLAAFLLQHGERPSDYLSAELAGSLRVNGANVTVDPLAASTIFYSELDDDTSAVMVSQLRGMRLEDPVAGAEQVWQSHPTTYVVCTKDRAIPPDAQRAMASRARQVIELPADHSSFLGQPATIAGVIADVVTTSRR